MKKLFLAFGLLLAVGGGCVSVGKLTPHKEVVGDWSLAFNLPSGWVMTVPYSSPTNTVVIPSQKINADRTEVYLQSTSKAIVEAGDTPDAVVPPDTYVTSGYTQIRADRLDSHRIISSDAEDLGHGFFKDGDTYYLKTDADNYKFTIYGDDVNQAVEIIKSAQVVTSHPVATTDQATPPAAQ